MYRNLTYNLLFNQKNQNNETNQNKQGTKDKEYVPQNIIFK